MSASGLSLYRNSTSDLSLLSTRSRSNRGRRSTSGQGRFCCSLRLAREAEPSPPPADFLFANPVGGGGGAEHSELRGRVDERRLAPGGRWVSAVCSRQDFSRALYPLAVRRRAPRWLSFGLGRGRRARGSGSPPAARTRRVSRSENRECIKSASERVPRSPASCTTRAREAEPSPPPADFLFANPVGGGGGAEHSELRGRVDERRLAPGGRWPAFTCFVHYTRARG